VVLRYRPRPGEKIPVDGEIVEGATIDEAMVTGESVVKKQPGNEVIGATLTKPEVSVSTLLVKTPSWRKLSSSQAQGSSTDSTTGRPRRDGLCLR